MRHSGDMFRTEKGRGLDFRNISAASVVTIILTVFSLVAAICVIANFEEFTARIAIWMVNLLSSGFLILVVIAVIVYFVMRMRWKMRRSFWGW